MGKNYINNYQDARMSKMEKHIEVINSELGSVKESLSQIKADLAWLKQSWWIIFTSSVSSLIGIILTLIFKK